tara:strand:- start:5103 stop:5429 length:327 start_codon:yes stop_codon:yes gene_type:complete
MVGVPKSLISTGAGVYPGTVDANQTLYITDIINVDTTAAGATIRDGSDSGNQLLKVPASSTTTLESPLKLTKGNKVYVDRADVSISYTVAGGPAITGPAGLTFTSTSY